MGIAEDKKTIKEIAEKLKQVRLKNGWTQEELAKKAGMDSNSLAKIERAESRPKVLTLTKIIKALGIKSTDILPD